MEDYSTLAMEDDGSLLIISRVSDGSLVEADDGTMTAINPKLFEEPEDDNHAGEIGSMPSALRPEMGQDNLENEEVDGGGTEDEDEPLNLEELNELLKKEQENMEHVRRMNGKLVKLMASLPSTAPTMTPIPDEKDGRNQRDDSFQSVIPPTTDSEATKSAEVRKASGALQNPWRKLTNFRRRRQQRLNQPTTEGINVQHFLQDYYRSLDTVSRYLIAASVIGFCVAFILLSWHGAQTHQNDMEMFKLKEKQYMSQQLLYEKSEERHESFRENLIHQRYEETRECQSTLKSYLSGRDSLLQKISKMEKESQLIRSRLEDTVQSQQQEILELQRELQQLRMEKAQSLSASYIQILFGFMNVLKNRSVQIAVGGFVALASVFLLMVGAFKK